MTTLAYLTARVDFPDDDVPERTVAPSIHAARAALQPLIESGAGGRLLRQGVHTAIVGRPNAGKSSVLNRLLGAERSIVTPIPGTTRDTVEETISLRGIPFALVDTAGLQDTLDPVEQFGITRSRDAIRSADLVVLVHDATKPLHSEERQIAADLGDRPWLLVWNKLDLLTDAERERWPKVANGLAGESVANGPAPTRVIGTAMPLDQGIGELEAAMLHVASGGRVIISDAPLVTNPRHLSALQEADDCLDRALSAERDRLPADFVRLDVGSALTALGKITGQTVGEDLLDEIFSRFCIGK